MAESDERADLGAGEETLVEKVIEEKVNGEDDSSSSLSNSDDGEAEERKESEATTATTVVSEVKNKKKRLFGRERPIHHVLGGGKPADVFLWRNKKASATVLGTATMIWVLFEIVEYHLLTLVAHILIFSLAVLFLWSNATTFVKKSSPRIPVVELPQEPLVEFASVVTVEINRVLNALREIASGRDLKKFLIVIAGLWVLSIVGSTSNLLTLLYIGFIGLHTVPALYEKHEDKVDSYAEVAAVKLKRHYSFVSDNYLSKIPISQFKPKKFA